MSEKSHSAGLRWLVWIPGIILFYFLSCGPAVWIYERTSDRNLHAALEFVYAPVEQCSHQPIIGEPITAYAEWWRKLADK